MARLPRLGSNLNAFLDMIAFSEIGKELLAISDDGYNVIVGSTPKRPRLFDSYKDHPRIKVDLPYLSIISTAAGRYQILMRYYDAYKEQLGLLDFSPESQDTIAIKLIQERHGLPYIERGNFDRAAYLCASAWASLPGAGYGQHENKLETLRRVYVEVGGTINE